jgi:hypothetical protein
MTAHSTVRSALVAVAALLLLGGVSQSEIIEHRSSFESGKGRQPDMCTAVPDGETFIQDFRTGWALGTEGGGVRLVLSSRAVTCRDPNIADTGHSPKDSCTVGWTLAFTVPSELLTPGVHELAGHPIDFFESAEFQNPASGCGTPGCSGGGGGGRTRDATLEIYEVSDACITGNIRRWESGWITPRLEFTGAFHAVRCTPAP